MLEHLAGRVLALLLDASLKSLPLLLATGLALLCLRRASAAVRHLVLLLTLVCLLLLPLLSSTLPGWHVRWPRTAAILPLVPPTTPTRALNTSPSPPQVGQPMPSADAGAPLPAVPDAPKPVSLPWPLFAGGLWLIGVCAVSMPVMAGLICVRSLRRRSFPIVTSAVTKLGAELTRELGLCRPVTLLQGWPDDAPVTPMTWGWRRPYVLLPSAAEGWPEERLRVVLLHELAHVRRGDWLWQMLAHAVCALYWFHPGVWLVARALRGEGERACDDQVLSVGISAPEYAQHLVEVARTLSAARVSPNVGSPMVSKSQIEGRVRAILQTGRLRTMMTPKRLVIAALMAAGVITPLASLRPVAQAQSTADTTPIAKSDPAAVRLLIQMTEAYLALQTYSGTEVAEGDGAVGMPYRLDLAYARPGKLAFTHTRTFGPQTITHHTVLDGKTLFETSSNAAPGRYARLTTPQTNYTLWQEALMIRCDMKFPITVQLLEDDDDDAGFKNLDTDPHTSVRLGPPGRMDGVAVDVVTLTRHRPDGDGTTVMRIGHDDHLLRQITETFSPGLNQKPRTTTQTFSHVQADPALPASTFVFTAPADALAVDVDPGGAHADPAAVSLVAQMYAASAALHSCSFTRTSTVTGVNAGSGKSYLSTDSRATFVIEKPDRVAMVRTSQEGEARAVADGTDLYVTTTETNGSTPVLPGRYLKLPLKQDDPNKLLWLSRFGNLPQYIPAEDFMPGAILGFITMPAADYDWKMGQPGVVDGEPVDTVTLRRDDGTSRFYDLMTLAISRRDHLLRQISEAQDAHQPLSRRVETYTDLQKNPVLPSSLFVFTPPPGSIAVATTGDLYTTH